MHLLKFQPLAPTPSAHHLRSLLRKPVAIAITLRDNVVLRNIATGYVAYSQALRFVNILWWA